MAPLGIITILVSAIRVGGPKWLKAIIGRAKENTAAAEIELMSSTSPEVCELFNGDSIVRCQGTSSVWEFICIYPKGYNHGKSSERLPLRYMPLEVAVKDKLLMVVPQSSPFVPEFMKQLFQSKDQSNEGKMGERDQGPPAGNIPATAASHNGLLSSISKLFPSMNSRSAESDVELGQYQLSQEAQPSHETQSEPFIAVIRDTSSNTANISLNLQNSDRRAGIRFIAFLGTLLQGGVLAFFGVMSYYPKVKPSFQKDDEPAAPYAFPLATSGTILLVVGMFICALVIESSTEETCYRTNDGSVFVMCWVQKGQTVSDQVFDSYAMSQSEGCPIITKSARGKVLKKNDKEGQRNTLEVATISGVLIGLVGFVVQFIGLRAMNSAASLAQLAAVGIMTLCRALVRPGFARSYGKARLLPEFELNWLAWKLVTERSVLGASPAEDERDSGNEPGNEPDNEPGRNDMSDNKKIDQTSGSPSPTGEMKWTNNALGSWAVVTGETTEYKQLSARREGETTAQELMLARREICKLANFQGKTSEIAINLALSIEDALRVLLPDGISKVDSHERGASNSGNDGDTDGGSENDSGLVLSNISWLIEVNYGNPDSIQTEKQEISIDLSYHDGNWQIPADSLDAVLSLWAQTIRAQEKRKQESKLEKSSLLAQKGDKWLRRIVPPPSLRLLGPSEAISKAQLLQDLELWVPQCFKALLNVQESETTKATTGIENFDESRVLGCCRFRRHGKDDIRCIAAFPVVGGNAGANSDEEGDEVDDEEDRTALGIETHDTLEYLCAKDLFFSFMCAAAKTPGAYVKGEAELRKSVGSDEDSHKSQFLWNKELSDLADSCHNRGLGTYQEALLSIISPLSMAQILPFPHAWFQEVRARMAEVSKIGYEYSLLSIYRELWNRTKCYSPEKTGIRECGLAFILEAMHDGEKSDPLPFQSLVRVPKMLAGWLKTSTVGRRFCQNLEILSGWSHRPLNLDYFTIDDDKVDDDQELGDDEPDDGGIDNDSLPPMESFPAYFMLTESHIKAAYRKHTYTREHTRSRDIFGRVPIHYMAATHARNFFMELYVKLYPKLVNIQDYHGYTPLHYACGFGSPDHVFLLLEYGARLDIQGLDGMNPMHLAAHQGNGPAISQLLEWTSQEDKVSLKILWRSPDYNHKCPIHWAILEGHEEVIDMLKADIDVPITINYPTSLFLAARYCRSDMAVVQKLAGLSGDLDKQNSDGETALMYACRFSNWKAADVLVRSRADPNICDKWGENPLYYAVRYEASADLIQTLFNNGARMQLPAEGIDNGETLLHAAASNGDEHVIEALLVSLSSAETLRVLGLRDPGGRTPLQVAEQIGHEEAARVLREADEHSSKSS
ncbi:hypothetical protein IL306_006208 [Fusarium sp. DS 682]|nr:hypothetical protein IL306_006208 [Fusarium sp. DS 682]